MKKITIIFVIMIFSSFQIVYAQERLYSQEMQALRQVNEELQQQLSEANKEIKKLQNKNNNSQISGNLVMELEKAKRNLANQSCEIRMLREKLMITKDYVLNGE